MTPSYAARQAARAGLVKLADVLPLPALVRWVMLQSGGVAVKTAADDVLAELADDHSRPFFLLLPGCEPQALPDHGAGPPLPEELAPRGRRVLSYGIGTEGAQSAASQQARQALSPAPLGRDGVLAYLRCLWVSSTPAQAGDTHLDAYGGAAVAMLRVDAVALFGFGAAEAVPLHVVQGARESDESATELKRPNACGDVWTEQARAALLLQHASLRTGGCRPMKIEAADAELARLWGCSASTVKDQRCKGLRERETLSGVTASKGKTHCIGR